MKPLTEHTFDSSQTQAFKDCEYKYKLTYVDALKRRTDGETEHDREYGSALHEGFEALFKGKSLEEAKDALSKAYPIQLDESDKAKTLENGLVLLEEFQSFCKDNYAGYEVVEVEKVGEIDLGEGILFRVKPDAVLKSKSSGEFYSMDNKTTGNSLQATFWNRFDPAAWLTAQSAYVEQKFGSCSGVFVNGISFGYRSRMYKGEPAGFHSNIERQLFNRNKLQIERWKQDAKLWIKRIEQAKQEDAWGKNTEHCRWCSYRPICMAEWTPEEDRELIEEMYEVGVDPYAYLEDKSSGT